jgi:hypothetical protein
MQKRGVAKKKTALFCIASVNLISNAKRETACLSTHVLSPQAALQKSKVIRALILKAKVVKMGKVRKSLRKKQRVVTE